MQRVPCCMADRMGAIIRIPGIMFDLQLTRSSRLVGWHVNAKRHKQNKFGGDF